MAMIKICLIALVCLGCDEASSPKRGEASSARTQEPEEYSSGEIEEQPWLASVQLNGTHICSGSIMAGPAILTAAHCVFFLSLKLDRASFSLSARVGSSRRGRGGSVYEVRQLYIHELFFQDSNGVPHNDVALLALEGPVRLSRTVQPVLLFNRGETLAAGSGATFAGWSAAGLVVGVELATAEPRGCLEQSYPGEPARPAGFFHGQICALFPTNGSWRGDPGGPLLAGKRPRQAGIASWGTACGRPAFFTEVAYYYDWIVHNMMLAERPRATSGCGPAAWAPRPTALSAVLPVVSSTILLARRHYE